MSNKRLNALAENVYAALLRLYPQAFREASREPMLQAFRDLCRDADEHGMMRLWLAALADLLKNALAERARQMMSRQWLLKALTTSGAGAAYLISWFILAFTVMLITYFMLIPWDEGPKPSGTFAAAVNNLVEGSNLAFVPSMIVTVCEVIAIARLTRRGVYSAALIYLHFFLLNSVVILISIGVAESSMILIRQIFPQPAPFVINPDYATAAVYAGLVVVGTIIGFFVRLARKPAHLPLTRRRSSAISA